MPRFWTFGASKYMVGTAKAAIDCGGEDMNADQDQPVAEFNSGDQGLGDHGTTGTFTEPEPIQEAEEIPRAGACPVVGIGASAGGLDAFTQMLKQLPSSTGMAFVLVQHLDPNHKSMLTALLRGQTSMPVQQASQGTEVAPNHIYVIPPNSQIAIKRGVLVLTPRAEDGARNLTIDFFLSSLARDQKSRSIGVILSGAASDGTIGRTPPSKTRVGCISASYVWKPHGQSGAHLKNGWKALPSNELAASI
jgi:chemotaxis response regulator CheB